MRILLGTDGSEGARWAGEMVGALPLPPPVDVTVIGVVDVSKPPFTSLTPIARQAYEAAVATLRQEAEEAATKALGEAQEALQGRVTSVAVRLRHGPAAATLIEMAEAMGPDLVVVGSRGLGPVKQILLGSVSNRVVRYAPCSVLISRGPVGGLQRVLLGVDGSVCADEGARFVASLSLPPDAAIHFCAVAEQPIFGPGNSRTSPEAQAAALRTIARVARAEAERVLANARELVAAKGCAITSSLREGHPVDHLLAAIREFRPDLVVIGAKGRTAETRFALGSVTHMVLKYASCSVLVVRS